MEYHAILYHAILCSTILQKQCSATKHGEQSHNCLRRACVRVNLVPHGTISATMPLAQRMITRRRAERSPRFVVL